MLRGLIIGDAFEAQIAQMLQIPTSNCSSSKMLGTTHYSVLSPQISEPTATHAFPRSVYIYMLHMLVVMERILHQNYC